MSLGSIYADRESSGSVFIVVTPNGLGAIVGSLDSVSAI